MSTDCWFKPNVLAEPPTREEAAGADFLYSFEKTQNWFGAAIGSHIVNAWAVAEYYGFRRLVIGGKWTMTPASSSERSWSYYFEPYWASRIPVNVTHTYPTLRTPQDYWFPSSFTNWSDYRDYIIRTIYRPKAWVRDETASRVARLDLPEHYVAMHIRRGDKVNHEGKYHHLREYVESIPACVTIKDVVICTNEDLGTIREEIREVGGGYNFILDESEIRRVGPFEWMKVSEDDGHELHDALVVDEMLTAFKNTELLRNGEWLVGCRSSYFYVLAQRLRGCQKCVSFEENVSFNEEGKPW